MELRHYLVAFIDILGQGRELEKLQSIPTNPEEEAQVRSVLEDTVAVVRSLRSGFIQFVQQYAEHTKEPRSDSEKRRAELKRLSHMQIGVRGVSDAIILTVPIKPDDAFASSMNGVFGTLFGLAGMFLLALAGHKCLRGGCDIGPCVEIGEGEVYGAALERAYRLEAESASWPRVVIGQEMLRFLSTMATLDDSSQLGGVTRRVARACRDFVIDDSDGKPILDILGPEMRRFGECIKNQVPPAYHFVRSQAEQQRLEGNTRLQEKYGALLAYMQPRIAAWGVSDSEPV